jgi:hypothetical protein
MIVSEATAYNTSSITSYYVLETVTSTVETGPTNVDQRATGLKYRITRSGNTFTTYLDADTGSWQQIGQFTINDWDGMAVSPMLYSRRYGFCWNTMQFDNFIVNSGEVVDTHTGSYTDFSYDPVDTIYSVDDTFGEWTVVQNGGSDVIKSVADGLQMTCPQGVNGFSSCVHNTVFDGNKDFILYMDLYRNSSSPSNYGGWTGVQIAGDADFTQHRLIFLGYYNDYADMRLVKYENSSQTFLYDMGSPSTPPTAVFYDANTHALKIYNRWYLTSTTIDFSGGPIYVRLIMDNWGSPAAMNHTFKKVAIWGTENS